MDRALLERGLRPYGLILEPEAANRFERYMSLLLEWNRYMNLTAITDENEIVKKHFIDSASCLSIAGVRGASRRIDVGTGAGFPGLPMAILDPGGTWVLADALTKRVKFLEAVVETLGLEGVEAIHGRAEELGRNPAYREAFDLVVSRAVAHLTVLSEYCLPFASVGGLFVAMKGPKAAKEVRESEKAIRLLGGRVRECVSIESSFDEWGHQIIVIEKIHPTPDRYPRRPGQPAKKPIK